MHISFTFIIPFYNLPLHYLERMLSSIPRREDVQIIVVDDCSSKEIVNFEELNQLTKKYGAELIVSSKNEGPGASRNKALKVAKGDWILFADADDQFNANELSILMELCLKVDYEVIYFEFKQINIDGSETIIGYNDYNLKCADVFGLMPIQDRLPFYPNDHQAWKKVVKKELIDRHCLRFENIVYCEDQKFSVDILKYASKIALWPHPVYYYMKRLSSITRSLPYQALCDAMISTIKINRDLIKSHINSKLIVGSYILGNIRKKSYFNFLRYTILDYKYTGFESALEDYKKACGFCMANPNPFVDLADRVRVYLGRLLKRK